MILGNGGKVMPDLRLNLKNASFRNKGLQDILKSCTQAIEVITVEPYTGRIHNTKITLKINKGDNLPLQERFVERVHFYNRVNILTVIPEEFETTGNYQDDLELLNNLGCDFTEDDIIITNGVVSAKPSSLGYQNVT